MLYITVSKREGEAATPFILTALPLHRIFKVQFHTIAVGVSVRGILKKKTIKPRARKRTTISERKRERKRKGERERERKEEIVARKAKKERSEEVVVDRSRKSGTMTVHPPWRATFRVTCDYYSLCDACIARDRERIGPRTRALWYEGLVELQIQSRRR